MMLTVAEGLEEKGHKVDLILASATGSYLKNVPTSLHSINLNSKRVFGSTLKLAAYFRRHHPDCIISSLPHVNLVSVFAKIISSSKSTLILVEHNTLSQSIANATSLRGRHLDKLMRLVYPQANQIIAVSKGVADDLATTIGIPRGKIRVIYNPVVTPRLLVDAHATLDHPWFQKSTPPVILGVGRLTHAKNFQSLVQAFALVRKDYDTKLVILGDGPERIPIMNLAIKLGVNRELLLPGFVGNPYQYMNKAAVFALSSLWEGLPTALIEALACGTQVVSTDCLSGPKEILQGGRWGTLVPINDEDALANAIKSTLAQLPQVMPKESWAKFTLEHAISNYSALLDNFSDL